MHKELSESDIRFLKKYSEITKIADKESKKDHCLLCGKKCQSFCKSHIIPQFVLNNIAENGYLYRGLDVFVKETSHINDLRGINNTWTFKVICNECDQKYFKDYESEMALVQPPTTRIMAEIGLKSTMMMIAKRYHEISFYNQVASKIHNKELLDEEQNLDVRDFLFDFKRLKKIIDKNLKSGLTLLYYKVLDYITPLAMQGPISVHRDLDGEIVNDVNNYDPNIKMQSLFCAVFPLKQKTVIMLFHLRDDRNYVKFDRKFLKLPEEEKICYINYLIFKYCEHFALSPKVKKEIILNDKLIKLSKEHNDSKKKIQTIEEILLGDDELVYWKDIPNLLSEENQII